MPCRTLAARFLLTLLLLAGIPALPAQEAASAALPLPSPAWRAEDGNWRELFDGRSLDAWRFLHDKPVDPRFWRAEDGLLRTLPGGQWGADLITRDSFSDFVFCAEWKVESGGNSGILYNVREDQWRGQDSLPGRVRRAWMHLAVGTLLFAVLFFLRRGFLRVSMIRALLLGLYLAWLAHSLHPFERLLAYAHYMQHWKAAGLEYQIYDDDGHAGPVMQPSHGNGALYDIFPPTSRESRPAGSWNESCIVLRGTRVEHWLNNVEVLAFQLQSAELQRAVARSRYRNITGLTTKFPTHIALQNHDGQLTWYRRLRVKLLP